MPLPVPVGVYLHVPFCRVRCPYCSFNVYTRRGHLADAYVDALHAELKLRASDLPAGAVVDTIYLGGGTPTLLSPEALAGLVRGVAEVLPVVDAPEITVETEPGTTDAGTFAALRSFATRVTVGVQSFDDDALQRIGRPHDAATARVALADARAAGFDNIDLDLMFGLPGQDLDAWLDDLRAAVDTGVAHLSLYNLTVEPHTTFATALRKGRLQLPDEDGQAAMLRAALQVCGDAGLEHYETSNFARPGFRSRHNQGYWTGRPYLGLGAGAHGFLPHHGAFGVRWWNHRPPQRWIDAVAEGARPEDGREELDRASALLEAVMLGLRQRDGLARGPFAHRFGFDPVERLGPAGPRLVDLGLIAIDPDCLKLTEDGVILTDSITETVARQLDTGQGSDNLNPW